MVVITGQVPVAAIGTDAFQECDTIGITRSVTKHNELVTSAADIPRAVREAFHIATTGRPGPGAPRHPQGHRRPQEPELADGVALARPTTRCATACPATSPTLARPPPQDPRGRRADPALRAPGDLRRRRHPQGPGRRGAARAGRAVRHPRRHHADGPGRLPRQPPARASACRACTATTPRSPRCSAPTCSSRSAAASTTASPARSRPSPPRPRSSTSTSTRPSSARSAGPTCRSSATAAS